MSNESKLSPHAVWLFALGAAAVAIGATYATAGMSWKVVAGIYFAVYSGLAFAAAHFTRANTLQVILPFVVAGGALATFYYVVIARAAAAVASTFGSGAGGGVSKMGMIIAVIVLVDTIIASCAGGLFGIKLRGAKLSDLTARR